MVCSSSSWSLIIPKNPSTTDQAHTNPLPMFVSPSEILLISLLILLRLLPLLLISGLVALGAMILIGFWRRSHDRALALLDAFPAVIEHEDGVRHAGVLRVRDSGLTLEFAIPASGHSPPLPITYLHYRVEHATINAIYRFEDELDKGDRHRRDRQLNQLRTLRQKRKPHSITHWSDQLADGCIRLWRSLRGQAFPQPWFHPHPVTGGSLLTGLAGDAFNPLLESYLGHSVVVRHRVGHTLHRLQGLLVAYSPSFLFLAGVPVIEPVQVRLSPEKAAGQELSLRWQWQDDRIEIRNQGEHPLLLDRIQVGDQVQELSMMVSHGQSFSLQITPTNRDELMLYARIIRDADILLPRQRAIVRQAAQLPGDLGAMDVVLALKPSREQEAEEQRLRKELHQRPHNAPAAVALARLLMQKGELDEAERFYRHALDHDRNLPDQGERARMELDQLRIRRAEEGRKQFQTSAQ